MYENEAHQLCMGARHTLGVAKDLDLRIVWNQNCTYELHGRWSCYVWGESRTKTFPILTGSESSTDCGSG